MDCFNYVTVYNRLIMNINKYKVTFYNLRWEVWVCLLLVISVLIVYWPVRNYEFINFDDPSYITENPRVQSGLSLKNVHWILTTVIVSNWHPLTMLSHMIDCQIYGMNPGSHHLTSVFFHIVNSLLLFFVFKKMTGKLWECALISALFALHPLRVESVVWISERKDVLSTFFWMLTIWSYGHYIEQPRWDRYLTVLLFLILGLMAKPMLVTMPFVLLLLDCWPYKRFAVNHTSASTARSSTTIMYLFYEKIPLFCICTIFSIITYLAQKNGGAVSSLDLYPLNDRIANALVAYVLYIGKMLWPCRLAVFYPHSQIVSNWQLVAACLLFVTITLFAIRIVRQRPYVLVGWFWYIGTLVPVIGLVQVGSQSMADRYTYIPGIGMAIIIVWGVSDLLVKWRFRKVGVTIITSVIALSLMIMTRTQVGYWANSVKLFKHAAEVTSDNFLAYNQIGRALAKQGDIEGAITNYLEALRIKPGYTIGHNNLGVTLVEQGRVDEAVVHYSKALMVNPGYPEAHNNLGAALRTQGKISEAAKHYKEAIRLKPNYDDAYYNLGIALSSQGKPDEAVKSYLKAIQINPYNVAAHNNLGTILKTHGMISEAIKHYSEALRINPDYEHAQINLKNTIAHKSEIESVALKIKEDLKSNPEDPKLYYKLGNFYKESGDTNKAIAEYQKALAIQPEFSEVLNDLALIYATKGKYENAIALFMRLINSKPEHAEAYYYIACIYARQNMVDKSVEWLKSAVEKGFMDWTLLKVDINLENIRGTPYYKELVAGKK